MVEILHEFENEIIYTVKKGEDKKSIAKKFGVDSVNINTLGAETLNLGDKVIINRIKHIYHTVKPAETLTDIANLYNIPLAQLRERAGGQRVFVGQKILIK